jgi:hypothetical protein
MPAPEWFEFSSFLSQRRHSIANTGNKAKSKERRELLAALGGALAAWPSVGGVRAVIWIPEKSYARHRRNGQVIVGLWICFTIAAASNRMCTLQPNEMVLVPPY